MSRLVSYRSGLAWQAGIEADGQVVALGAAWPEPGSDGRPLSIKGLLAGGPAVVAEVIACAQRLIENGVCMSVEGSNSGHQTRTPILFAKFRNSLVGPYLPVVIPSVSERVDYEAELAVVIGKRCHCVDEGEALSYVGGYTVINDVSARDLQRATSQWLAAKAIDTFAPMGPGIVPAAEIPDPQCLAITTHVNGERVQMANTSEMISSVAYAVSYISQIMTLEPGDVVEIEIEGVGVLQNPVVTPESDRSRYVPDDAQTGVS